MSDIDAARLREFFGRDFSDTDLQFYGARLSRQLVALERLRAWEPELGLIEPATVTRIVKATSNEH
ncbi:MAG: hypothetical protein P8N43_15500 [Alphaproteobacteria bacterium]|jgi:hypothetical protein|nr:hypothetical protein [Alphaproteobacteria bacterium]